LAQNLPKSMNKLSKKDYSMISSRDYIKWVQRSFNLIWTLNTMRVDGIGYDNTFVASVESVYRTAKLPRIPGVALSQHPEQYVNKRFQDVLIQFVGLHSMPFSKWVRQVLTVCGIHAPHGVNVPHLTVEIREFQRRVNGLVQDGVIGAKTDLAMLEISGLPHPGKHRRS
jgi:hypothetical protein